MGFRKHRRHRGGGGGHHHQHYGFGTGEPNGVQPGDDLGNRRQLKAVHLPPDDLGNRKDPDEAEWVPEDSVGNRIEASPTHELSGVLIELDGRRRRRRPKGVSAPERVGRFLVGGVNPLIAANVPRPFPGKTLEESYGAPARGFGDDERGGHDLDEAGGGEARHEQGRQGRGARHNHVAAPVGDGSDRRAQRFFDFEEDDRFEYTLKTPAEQKRADAERCVHQVVEAAGRDATVVARLIDDGTRPKVVVTVLERGPAATLPPERRSANAGDALFAMGNAALASLNYLVNKIVNRFPDDRIRLAILPASDERLYLDSLAEHRRLRPLPVATTTSAADAAPPAPAPVSELVAADAPSLAEPQGAAAHHPQSGEATGQQGGSPDLGEAAEPRRDPTRRGTSRASGGAPAAPIVPASAPEPAPATDAAHAATGGDDEPAPAAKPARRARAPKDDDEAPKRPARRPVRKVPAVEVVKAPRR
ncbi:MAG: hypothetical protein IT383_15595 [Deltaproteobacteria bacterium]|nr:hypothetical protein [Deltaproteobacteria bacterium]